MHILSRLFTDPNAKPLDRVERMNVPNLIPNDQRRKVAERIDATDKAIAEGEAIRKHTKAASVQFVQTVREMATGILGGDLLADRPGRISDRKGQ